MYICYYRHSKNKGKIMTTIVIEKECKCFKESDFENNQSFQSKDEALLRAKYMVDYMNDEFCGKHSFSLSEAGDTLHISVNMNEVKPKGGCCGGGHCS